MSDAVMNNDIAIEMARAGVLFGHSRTQTHPRMKPAIAMTRNEVELLDPQKTLESIERAAAFLKELLADKQKLVLFVATLPPARPVIEEIARELKMPYVGGRWLGGTLTNFEIMAGRIKHFQDLKEKKEKGALAKYTKKEQLAFGKEIQKLAEKFGGLVMLVKLPDALFIIDVREHATAVREARRLHIPVIAVVDTNSDPNLADFPIFANDHSRQSIAWVATKVFEGVRGENKG